MQQRLIQLKQLKERNSYIISQLIKKYQQVDRLGLENNEQSYPYSTEEFQQKVAIMREKEELEHKLGQMTESIKEKNKILDQVIQEEELKKQKITTQLQNSNEELYNLPNSEIFETKIVNNQQELVQNLDNALNERIESLFSAEASPEVNRLIAQIIEKQNVQLQFEQDSLQLMRQDLEEVQQFINSVESVQLEEQPAAQTKQSENLLYEDLKKMMESRCQIETLSDEDIKKCIAFQEKIESQLQDEISQLQSNPECAIEIVSKNLQELNSILEIEPWGVLFKEVVQMRKSLLDTISGVN